MAVMATPAKVLAVLPPETASAVSLKLLLKSSDTVLPVLVVGSSSIALS